MLNAAVGFDETTLTPTYELRLGIPGASAGINIASRLGLDPAIVTNARSQLTTQQADISRFLDELHAQLTAATAERAELAATERKLNIERQRLQQEGRTEQQARTRELERKLEALIRDFESQLRDTVKSIDDKKIAQKIARDSALRIARLRREFSEQFQTTVAATPDPADVGSSHTQPGPAKRDSHASPTSATSSACVHSTAKAASCASSTPTRSRSASAP